VAGTLAESSERSPQHGETLATQRFDPDSRHDISTTSEDGVLESNLPQIVLLTTAGLCFAGGRLFTNRFVWGPLCLTAVIAATGCLAVVTMRGLHAEHGWPAQAMAWFPLGLGLLFVPAALKRWRAAPFAADQFGLVLLSLAGLMFVGSVTDLISLFVVWQLVVLPSDGLLFLSRDRHDSDEVVSIDDAVRSSGVRETAGRWLVSIDPARKQLLLGGVSSLLLLVGFGLVGGVTGSTHLADARRTAGGLHSDFPAIADQPAPNSSRPTLRGPTPLGPTPLGIAATVLVFAGVGFRMAVVPFQFGIADIYRGTSTWMSGWLATVPKAASFIVLLRVVGFTLPGVAAAGQLVTMVAAGCTMLLCGTLALSQTNVRRLLAYTTMSHGGFALAGIAAGFHGAAGTLSNPSVGGGLPSGLSAGLLFLGGSLWATAGLFAILVYVERSNRPVEILDELKGLLRTEPAAAVAAAILLLSLIGLPPLCGFWGRLFVFTSTMSARLVDPMTHLPEPHPAFLLLSLAAVVGLAMMAAVYLRLLTVILLDGPIARPAPSGGQGALFAGVLAAVLALGVGLLPGPVIDSLQNADPPQQQSAEHR